MKAADKAYAIVREGILDGTYRPGARITEQEIVRVSGVSRTPVREAFRRLQSDGLVQAEPNVGVLVADYSAAEADDIFGLRVLLEGYCARLAAERIAVEELEKLREMAAAHRREVERDDPDLGAVARLNLEFHALLYQAARNPRLASILSSLIEPTMVRRTFEYYSRDALRRSAMDHQNLVDMLAAGFADGAESLIRTHVQAARLEYRRQGGDG